MLDCCDETVIVGCAFGASQHSAAAAALVLVALSWIGDGESKALRLI